MKGSTRIAMLEGELIVMVDGSPITKPVSRAVIEAVRGEPIKLYVEFDLTDTATVNAAYDEKTIDLSIARKAALAIEVLGLLQPEDVEDVLAKSTGRIGDDLLRILAGHLKKTFIGGEVEEDGNNDWPGPELRNGDFYTLAG